MCDRCDIFEKHASKIVRRAEKKKENTLLQITGGISRPNRNAEGQQQVNRSGIE